jgi:hypothetical protein
MMSHRAFTNASHYPALVCVWLLAAATPALAEEADGLATPREAIFTVNPKSDSLPSPGMAMALSMGATLIPIGAALTTGHGAAYTAAGVGILVGPSFGYFYGDCAGRGITGIMIRGGATAVGWGVALAAGQYGDIDNVPPGYFYAVLGAAILIGADALYDMGAVGEKVRQRNQVRRSLSLEPTLRMAADGTPMVGVTLRPGV